MKYRILKDRGILMPWRTIRAAKKADVPLSLVCALMVTGDSWKQREWIDGLDFVSGLIKVRNVHGAAKDLSQNPVKLLEVMAYFKRLGIS